MVVVLSFRITKLSLFESQMSNSRFDVSTQLLGTLHHLHLFCFFGSVSEVFLHTHFRGINGTLHPAQPNLYFFVEAIRVVVHIDG